jgi:hypothetical protein
MLVIVMALYNSAGLPQGPRLCGKRTQQVLRKKLTVLVAMVVMLAMASPALAVPGNGQGVGQGVGGGDISHVDQGNHKGTAKGEGLNNNPHNDGGCQISCG